MISEAVAYKPAEIILDIDLFHQTSILRGLDAVKFINRYFEKGKHLNVLIVGIGKSDGIFDCPYEPYQIVAGLEAADHDYCMTLVDVNAETINIIKENCLL